MFHSLPAISLGSMAPVAKFVLNPETNFLCRGNQTFPTSFFYDRVLGITDHNQTTDTGLGYMLGRIPAPEIPWFQSRYRPTTSSGSGDWVKRRRTRHQASEVQIHMTLGSADTDYSSGRSTKTVHWEIGVRPRYRPHSLCERINLWGLMSPLPVVVVRSPDADQSSIQFMTWIQAMTPGFKPGLFLVAVAMNIEHHLFRPAGIYDIHLGPVGALPFTGRGWLMIRCRCSDSKPVSCRKSSLESPFSPTYMRFPGPCGM